MSHVVRELLERGAIFLCPVDGQQMKTKSTKTGRVGHQVGPHAYHVACFKDEHDSQCECPPKEETND